MGVRQAERGYRQPSAKAEPSPATDVSAPSRADHGGNRHIWCGGRHLHVLRNPQPSVGLNDPDVSFVRAHLSNGDSGIDGERMFASVVGDGVAVASEQTRMVYGQLSRELALFLPVGLFIATFIVVMVVVFSRDRLSPRAELEFAIHKRQFDRSLSAHRRISDRHLCGCRSAGAMEAARRQPRQA